jgi:crotonobetainyl-CoA:carnitine CoA-transferase CaiB-like acyl-CoA transferase
MLVEMDHPEAGKIKQIGPVIKFSETPGELGLPPPVLGAHNDEVLSSLAGYSEEEISKLRESGAI